MTKVMENSKKYNELEVVNIRLVKFGDDLDKAVQLVYGEGFRASIAFDKALEVENDRLKAKMTSYNAEHKVRAMLVVNYDVDDEELIGLKLGEFAEVR